MNSVLCFMFLVLSTAHAFSALSYFRIPQRNLKTSLSYESPDLGPGDVVIIRGRFALRLLQVRFFANSLDCLENKLQNKSSVHCHPLVIRINPFFRNITLYNRGITQQKHDVELANYESNRIGYRHFFRLAIEVGKGSYTLKLNGVAFAKIDDPIGSKSISLIRSYGGFFQDLTLQRAIKPTVPPTATCGTRPGFSEKRFRITGGSNAKVGEFPWQAAIRLRNRNDLMLSHICGATLINSCWVATAAHCIIFSAQQFQSHIFKTIYLDRHIVRLGDYHNDNDTITTHENQQDFDIEEVFVHPQYVKFEKNYDIALIKLKSNTSTCAKFNNFVQPICLPTPEDEFPDESWCAISGWGALRYGDVTQQHSQILQGASVLTRNHEACQRQHGRNAYGEYLVNNHTVCAGGRKVDTCQGDSGGALACPKEGDFKNGRFVLWGITSWGVNCGDESRWGVYTKVSDYLPWIKSHINSESSSK